MTRDLVRETLAKELRRVERQLDTARDVIVTLEKELSEARAEEAEKEELCVQLRRALS